jgi:hypothetical protein
VNRARKAPEAVVLTAVPSRLSPRRAGCVYPADSCFCYSDGKYAGVRQALAKRYGVRDSPRGDRSSGGAMTLLHLKVFM